MGKSMYYHGERMVGSESFSGVDFTINDTLTMSKDNVLGVTIPTKETTKVEFDKMSNEEKKGLVVVKDDDMPSGSSCGEVYSTDEIVIGTWINKKPLYRKVYSVTSPNISDTQMNVFNLPVSFIVRNVYGMLYSTENENVALNTVFLSTNTAVLAWRGMNNKFWIYVSGEKNLLNVPVDITIEYTKTTD